VIYSDNNRKLPTRDYYYKDEEKEDMPRYNEKPDLFPTRIKCYIN